ncbi:hypothetical protein ACIQD5_29740 [Streptomyces microflavus]|uniref:hypothetical protein n=1 Tax=Streptomyces microflavus TaxID=1919 RepID=UPI00380108DD
MRLRAADERFNEANAARPVIRPELIIYDQGSPYVSEHFTEVCDRLRIARRPARKGTGHKSVVERSSPRSRTASASPCGVAGRAAATRSAVAATAQLS